MSCSWDKTAKVWDAVTHALLAEFKEDAGIYHCDISRDGSFVATTGGVWDVENKKKVVDFAGIEGGVSTMAISPDGNRVLTAAAARSCT